MCTENMRQSCQKGHAKVTAAALSQDSRLTRAKGSLTTNKDSARKTKRPDAAFSQTTYYTQPRLEHRKQLKLGETYCLCVCAKSVLAFGA
jgi:hypothetical protein